MQLAALSFLLACLQASLAQADTITVTMSYTGPTTLATALRAVTSATQTQAAADPSDTGNQIDTDAGAAGNDHASFKISQGTIIAIVVVCVVVILLGIASTALFVVAKRRQWKVRASLARVSRRLTCRLTGNPRSNPQNRERRAGIRLEEPRAPGTKTVLPPGHKRGLVVDVQPLQSRSQTGMTETPQSGASWTRAFWRKT